MKTIHDEVLMTTRLEQKDFWSIFDGKMKDVTTREDRREKLKSIHYTTLVEILDKQTPQFTKWHAVTVSLRARARAHTPMHPRRRPHPTTHTHTHTHTHNPQPSGWLGL